MPMSKVKKRRRAKERQICLTKRAYATDLEAAHTAGLQALKWNTRLFIYKCPVGNHWHLSRSAPCQTYPSSKAIKSGRVKKVLTTKEPSSEVGSGRTQEIIGL